MFSLQAGMFSRLGVRLGLGTEVGFRVEVALEGARLCTRAILCSVCLRACLCAPESSRPKEEFVGFLL